MSKEEQKEVGLSKEETLKQVKEILGNVEGCVGDCNPEHCNVCKMKEFAKEKKQLKETT